LASVMHRAGIILSKRDGEGERAGDFLSRSLSLRREHLEKFSFDTASTLYAFAKIQNPENDSDAQKIFEMFTEATNIFIRHEKHEDSAACLSRLGTLELSRNIDKSLSYYKKAWAIYMENDLERADEAANILYGIGFIHNQKLEFKQSVDLFKECLKIRIREEGKNSLNVAKTCEQLGSALLSLGQHEDALKLYVTSLEIFKDIYGESAVPCARVMLDIATLYSYKQQFDLALVQLTACLQFIEIHHGKESEEVATVLLRIGQVHDMRVDNEEAMKCVSRALEIRIKLYTKDDIRVAETYLICGKVLEDWGDIDEVSRQLL
jgi:tetratricopeptide (TPR) repeat protein